MVLVEVPYDSRAATAASGERIASAETDSVSAQASPSSDEAVNSLTPPSSEPVSVSATPKDGSTPADGSAGRPAASSPADAASTAGAEGLDAPPLLPAADWTSPAVQQWRQRVMLGGAAVLGVILAVGVYGLSLHRSDRTSFERPQAPANAKADGPAERDRRFASASAADEAAPQRETQTPAATSEDERQNAAASRVDEQGEPAVEGSSRPEGDDSAMARPPATQSVSPDAGDAPPDFAADSSIDSRSSPAATASSDVDSSLEGSETKPEGASDNLPSTASTPPAMETSGEVPSLRPPPALRVADIESGLGCKLREIKFDGVAIADFVQQVSDLIAAPITLDLDAMALMGVTASTPVQIHKTDTTVGEILSAATGPLGLCCVTHPGRLVVTCPAENSDDWEQVSHGVADLVQGDAERLAALQSLVVDLVAPDSWSSAGGSAVLETRQESLVVRQRRAAHFQVLQLLEKLRVARGLELQSGRPSSDFRLESRRALAHAVLSKLVTVDYSQTTRFSRILEGLGDAASARILVDWRAVGELGWSLEAEATLVVGGRSLAQGLDQFLAPMGLSYRIVDENTLQITTPQELAARVELEFYPVGDFVSDERDASRLIDQLRAHLGQHAFRDGGGNGVLRFDSASCCMVAALPQPRQIALAEFLDQKRKRQ